MENVLHWLGKLVFHCWRIDVARDPALPVINDRCWDSRGPRRYSLQELQGYLVADRLLWWRRSQTGSSGSCPQIPPAGQGHRIASLIDDNRPDLVVNVKGT